MSKLPIYYSIGNYYILLIFCDMKSYHNKQKYKTFIQILNNDEKNENKITEE